MRHDHAKKAVHGTLFTGNAKVVRNINRSVILNLIREKQPISRIKIARSTGLNKSTVSSIVTDLLEEDLVFQEVSADQNVGRTPIHLCLKLNTHFVGAVSFDSPTTRIAIVDLDGSVKDSLTIDTEHERPEQFVDRCIHMLFSLRDRWGIPRLSGLGVSVAGIVDPVKGMVLFAPRLQWENFDLGALLKLLFVEEGFVSIENDARASALAELWYGKHGLELSNFVFLAVGPGIGTGIVVGKNLIHGASHAAGEFGHMTLFEGGELCSCGNNGCWEAYASDRATVRRYLTRRRLVDPAVPEGLTLVDVIQKAGENETLAKEILLETGHYLGMGIADIIKAVDPEAIIVGGHIVDAWEIVYPEIMRTLSNRAFFGKNRSIRILPSSLGMRPRLLGAATMALKETFSDYRITR